jgi:hypothetical protein
MAVGRSVRSHFGFYFFDTKELVYEWRTAGSASASKAISQRFGKFGSH